MDIHLQAGSSILVLLALICGVVVLRRTGIIEQRQAGMFSKLTTRVTLPSVILVSLTHADLAWNNAAIAGLMLSVSVFCLGLGWAIARGFGLDRASTGAVVLASGFGSSSLLGFALITEMFPGDDPAMAEAAILSGLGVQPLMFTAGALIARYYGASEQTPQARRHFAYDYLRSPIFIALVVGLGLSMVLDGDRHPLIEGALDGLHVVGAANTMMVLLSVGLLLRFDRLGDVAGLAVAVGSVNLVVMPILLWLTSHGLALDAHQVEVLVLEGSMPAALLTVALCDAYGADAGLASRLVLATMIASVVTVPALFMILA